MSHWQERHRAVLSVYLVLQNKRGEVLLLLRKNTGFCDGQYGLPAGHVDGEERLHTAMAREAKEETGIDIAEKDLELIHVMHRNSGDHERVDFFFHCTKWSGDVTNVEPHKCAELSWYALESLPKETIEYYQQMFEHWQKQNLLSYYGWNK